MHTRPTQICPRSSFSADEIGGQTTPGIVAPQPEESAN
jgi:hypothetical protein